jgi:hypothetical protein
MEVPTIFADIYWKGKIFSYDLLWGLVPVTNNLKEFERVPALETENWISAAV